MMDANHKVTTGIDVSEFYQNQPDKEEQDDLLNSAFLYLLLYAALFCVDIVVFTFIAILIKQLILG